MTKLSVLILLISVCAAGAIAQTSSPPDKSQSPSPVKTNAEALIAELKKPINCAPDDTLCFSEITLAKLNAAVAGLESIVRIDEQREGIIADMQRRIDVRGGIIDDLQKVDANSQRVDTLGQDSRRVFEEQHRDDKDTIADLQQALDSCRGNQKWVFGGGVLAGFAIGYKVRGAGTFQTPFTSTPQLFATSAPFIDFSQFQTSAEQRARAALKSITR